MPYSVLTEPVIPVVTLSGEYTSLGLRDVFLRAHEIGDIQGKNPLERYALMRLLIAFAMDMLHPDDRYERKQIFARGRFDAEQLDAYIRMCEQDGPRFDLLDPVHPFMQSAYDEKLDSKAQKVVAALFHAIPSGNNHVFLDHRYADEHEYTIAEAFAGMCAMYTFATSGAQGYPSSVNNTPPVYTIVVGQTLFETIVLNMLSAKEAGLISYGVGTVPWRSSGIVIPKETAAQITLLEGMTWQPRRITLMPDDDGMVRKVCLQQGRNFTGNELWYDMHVPQFRKKDGSYGTVKPDLGRSFWRDVGALLYDNNGDTGKQPQVIKCIDNMFDSDRMPAVLKIRAAGLVTNQAAYTGWMQDEVSLPLQVLDNAEYADLFREDISMLDRLQHRLYQSVQTYIDKPRSGSESDEKQAAVQAQQMFLQSAHTVLFGEILQDVLETDDPIVHIDMIAGCVQKILKTVIKEVVRTVGDDLDSIMHQYQAEGAIWKAYNDIVKERKDAYAL